MQPRWPHAVSWIVLLWVEWQDSREEASQDHLANQNYVRYQKMAIFPHWLLNLHWWAWVSSLGILDPDIIKRLNLLDLSFKKFLR